jgi:outer membrane protein OmpA-like peptidoglycan-associated protein
MHKLVVVLLIGLTMTFSSACIASRKFVRNEVKTSSDTLNARIESTETTLRGEVSEVRDGVDRVNQRVTGVDDRLTQVASDHSQRIDTLNGDVQGVDEKAGMAHSLADRAATGVIMLDQRFQNRNNFSIANEKSVHFRVNSAELSPQYQAMLDEIATELTQNPDALLVLEGRTDSTGDADYNVRLGERRIESVRRYLAVEKGVPVYRIHEISFGAARPIASNDSREGREQNRAVTMTILVPRMDGSVVSRD